MGDGLCITPAPSADTVVAPADATVTVTNARFNHAVGLTLDNVGCSFTWVSIRWP